MASADRDMISIGNTIEVAVDQILPVMVRIHVRRSHGGVVARVSG
jgi:hypothetical protein